MIRKVLIVDGYNDEPGGLGVPPYIDVYPRYIAGAIWSVDNNIKIVYITIDQLRNSRLNNYNSYDLVIFSAGVVVPGKYIGGKPITGEELLIYARILNKPFKVLVGPAAKWGMGQLGGREAISPSVFKKAGFDILVTGDPEIYFYDFFKFGESSASPHKIRENYDDVDKFSVLGAKIIKQHPNYGKNLIVELETYRGCSRWISGGCSFCVEPLRGKPIQRKVEGIVKEVKALYDNGARSFRLGRQADIIVYGSNRIGEDEWPIPNPNELERLFYGIRFNAPNLHVLHIDNVNPGTISRYPKESKEALIKIIKYHTPGDVAAFGIESLDPNVIKINNLKVTFEDAIKSIEIVNSVGSSRGYNGLPEILPGINFILGLPGETKETYRYNKEFLEEIVKRKLMVRRVNVRKLLALENTKVYRLYHGIRRKNEGITKSFIHYVRDKFDPYMLSLVVPQGTILKDLWVEECDKSFCYARQVGSYPLMVIIKGYYARLSYINEIKVLGVHSSRAIRGEVITKNDIM
ncbi:MAG: radical SAM protein [Caldisphaera sp.]